MMIKPKPREGGVSPTTPVERESHHPAFPHHEPLARMRKDPGKVAAASKVTELAKPPRVKGGVIIHNYQLG